MFDRDILSVEERESRCYNYFHTNCIENREQLREQLKLKPIPEVRTQFVEDIFSDFLYRKKLEEKRRNQNRLSTTHESVFVLSDMHIPFQDDETIRTVFDCIVDNQPTHIVLLGDILDCYMLSRFLKNPDKCRYLQHEIDIFYKMMRELKKYLPHTNIHYVLGNHENRIKTLAKNDAGIYGLDALSPYTLLKLDKLDINLYETKTEINGFIYYHGDVVRKDSANSAKAEFYDHNCRSGISGHTHRAGSYYKTYAKEVGFWLENGCLCKMDPEYINDPDKANWQHCINVIDSFDGINQGTQIVIHNHTFMYNGKIYK